MNTRYRLTSRGVRGGIFYCVDKTTGKRTSLKTTNKDEAEQIVLAKNQSLRQPALNLQIAKAYRRWRASRSHPHRPGSRHPVSPRAAYFTGPSFVRQALHLGSQSWPATPGLFFGSLADSRQCFYTVPATANTTPNCALNVSRNALQINAHDTKSSSAVNNSTATPGCTVPRQKQAVGDGVMSNTFGIKTHTL
jgi:hypothetical protein